MLGSRVLLPWLPTKSRIDGEGTMPIVADGAMQRLERGTPVKVTDAQLEALKAADIRSRRQSNDG